MTKNHDFGGYATKADLVCSDGRTIDSDAFKHMDGQEIPLVWQHLHDDPGNVLGHAKLEHRADGMYAWCYFNDTDNAKVTKKLVEHGDVKCLSIYANQLREKNKRVLHGEIGEVSVVLKGANKGATIDYVRVEHNDGSTSTIAEEAVIVAGFDIGIELEHASDSKTETYQDVYDSLNPKQVALLEFMLSQALEHSDEGDESEDKDEEPAGDEKDKDKGEDDSAIEHKDKDGTMTRNVFDKDDTKNGEGVRDRATLNHSQIQTILKDAKKPGMTLKESFLQHADEYGIDNIDLLFPDARALDTKPEWITRRLEWVEKVLGGARKVPFAKIKSLAADLTHEEARAKGYIKGELKKEQFFAITKRETTPQTIYKKQRLDRDDIIDVTDFDIVQWLWVEMYFMLREEIARAILVGDGREIDDPDKIQETKIRPVAYDDPFYTDVISVPANVDSVDLIEAVLRGRNAYKGTAPTAFMTNAVMVDMLLSKDSQRRRYYNNKAELAAALMVNEIVEVPVMEGLQRDGAELLIVIVNMGDYSVGTNAGGEITKFDDFDIDYNQYKYLIEGRSSGALTKYKSAQVVIRGTGTLATLTAPTFNSGTGVITIPTVTGVTYKLQDTGPLGAAGATLTAGNQTALTAGQSQSIVAVTNTGYYFPHNSDADWVFTRPAA